MNLTPFAIPFVAFALAGCAANDHPDSADTDAGYRSPEAPTVSTPMAPSVDHNMNSVNHTGTSEQNGGSSSPAGATGVGGDANGR